MGQELRTLLEGAVEAFGNDLCADIGEARRQVVGIVDAAGLGPSGNDIWSGISFEEDGLAVRVAHSERGPFPDDVLLIPHAVIDHADPLWAARHWGLEIRILLAENGIEAARHDLAAQEAELAAFRAELADVQAMAA